MVLCGFYKLIFFTQPEIFIIYTGKNLRYTQNNRFIHKLFIV